MLEALDQIIAALVPSINQMGQLLAINVNMPTGTVPLSTAALEGFVMPWVNNLGQLLQSVAQFLNSL